MSARAAYQHTYYELILPPIEPLLCPCGCREMFMPRRRGQIYKNRNHKCRVHSRRLRRKRNG